MNSSDSKTPTRCAWATNKPDYYVDYHDNEWGRAITDDQAHFELICLEGAQAGLSWDTVLQKRERYRKVFKGFEPKRCAKLSDTYLEKLLEDKGIIRNRLKVYSVRTNAQVFLKVQTEFGSFNDYIWSYVDHEAIINRWKTMKQVPAKTELSDAISKDLKKRGFKFVGSTIVYAYLQSAGLVVDHTIDCAWHPDNIKKRKCKR